MRNPCLDKNGNRRKGCREPESYLRTLSTRRELHCIHEGKILSACPHRDQKRDIRECARHGQCRRGTVCTKCRDYSPHAANHAMPSRTLLATFDEHNLHPGHPGKRFNPSIIEWQDGYAFLWRHGWAGSDLWVSDLDAQFRPRSGPIKLEIHHHMSSWGREDPRFFWFKGELHVSFTGVLRVNNRDTTNVLYARLGDGYRVRQVYYPQIQGRNSWEKNHAYFEHDGQLYASYISTPHRILRVDGNRAEWAYSSNNPLPWNVDGEIRGGAAPVLIDDEWWHFFHSRIETYRGRQYCMGLLTFRNTPPFAIKRIIPDAIMWADWSTKPNDQYAAAIFPCGAALKNGKWIISMGLHDRWSEIWEFDHEELKSLLVEV